ncbi:MAG: helix-turn-helix domain-containing protein [Bacteroidota bacterium]
MELGELRLDKVLLFFFSAIGVINTFFLTLYFSLFVRNRSSHNRILAALLFVIGLRETKSVLVLFSGYHVQYLGFFGQTVSILIGPLLYLYVTQHITNSQPKRQKWASHTLPYLVLIAIAFYLIKLSGQPYTNCSSEIGGIIFVQWFVYIGLSLKAIKGILKKLYKRKKLEKNEFWVVTLIGCVFIIWLAYLVTHYGNYILGGVSISAVLYLSLILWLYGRRSAFFETPPKYENKKINDEEARQLLARLNTLMVDEELFLNPNVKLGEVATRLDVSQHLLSQVLNDNLKINFNHYVNQFRIQAATEMIKSNHHITLEAIGTDSGFKSKSTFYAAFKSIQGQTPAQFRKVHIPN